MEMNEDMGEDQEIKGANEDTPMIRFLLQQYTDIFIEKRDNEFTPIYVETRVPGEKPRLFVVIIF